MSDLKSRENPYNVTQASRIYFLPNLMTAGNLLCGFGAVIKCIQARLLSDGGAYAQAHPGHEPRDYYIYAVWLILAAVLFDSLDGRLARMGGRTSLFGAEFDSLADVVSFGIAPALMVFFLILAPQEGYQWFREFGWFVAFIYLLCAAVRLARFNVITNPLLHRSDHESNKDFLGLPVPAAAGAVASLVLLLLHLADNERSLQKTTFALPLLLLLISMLMVSTIRYPTFKQVDWHTKTRLWTFILLLIMGVIAWKLQEIAFFVLFLGYICFGIGRHVRRMGTSKTGRVLRKEPVSKSPTTSR
ncbi:MAG: CDP-diacylglycerol--serine O-phosphatidyltransferase [Opitutaceae bacterium]|nr:CDP-diacylglycerol--serine O-phosphatidyltransferase [Opitutaceae bacterium]